MKLKCLFIFNAFILCSIFCKAQNNVPDKFKLTEVKISQTVPDIEFTNIINYTLDKAKLSDFAGKSVIIDFWATWCVACVEGFPKLEKLQAEYKDKLKVILVANDTRPNVDKFYGRRKGFTLPTVIADKANDPIQILFPHIAIPHYVWIDKNRKVVAVTDGVEVNERNVGSFVEGMPLNVSIKNDSLKLKPLSGTVIDSLETLYGGRITRVSINPKIEYQSVISRYDSRLTPSTNYATPGFKRFQYLDFPGHSIVNLYIIAFWGYSNVLDYKRDRTIVELTDSTVDYPRAKGYTTAQYEDWAQKYAYSYRLILPSHMADSATSFATMQRDISNFFGYKAAFENRKIKCFVITALTKDNALKSKGGKPLMDCSLNNIVLVNQSMGQFLAALKKWSKVTQKRDWLEPYVPVFDETGWSENIDIDIHGDLNNFNSLKNILNQQGLDIKEAERMTRVLVISNR